MSNRSQEENISLLLQALRQAGDHGLNAEEARQALFGNEPQSKTAAKKVLEHLKARGYLKVRVDKLDVRYVLIPGH